MNKISTALFVALILACNPVYSIHNEALSKELLSMKRLDQDSFSISSLEEREKVFQRNLLRLKEIVREFGWPTIEMVGASASQGAWLIVQHADHAPEYQQRTLEIIQPLAESKAINPSEYAYLYDRLHKPQLYGTQGKCIDGQFTLHEVVEPEALNSRRASYGLEPIDKYIATASKYACNR